MTDDERFEALTEMVERLTNAVETLSDNQRKLTAIVGDMKERVRDLDRRTIGLIRAGGS